MQEKVFAGRFQKGYTDLVMTIDEEEGFGEGKFVYAGQLLGKLDGEPFVGDYETTKKIHKQKPIDLLEFILSSAHAARVMGEITRLDNGEYFSLKDGMQYLQKTSGF